MSLSLTRFRTAAPIPEASPGPKQEPPRPVTEMNPQPSQGLQVEIEDANSQPVAKELSSIMLPALREDAQAQEDEIGSQKGVPALRGSDRQRKLKISEEHEELDVEPDVIGSLIGRGGCRVRELSQKSGAFIRFEAGTSKMVVGGTDKQVRKCVHARVCVRACACLCLHACQ